MAKILDGKATAEKIRENLKKKVDAIKKKPGLAAIIVGNNPASKIYVGIKRKTCEKVGIYSEVFNLPEETSKEEMVKLLHELNKNEKIDGILVQLPLPKHLNEEDILAEIDDKKDVDGFGYQNINRLFAGKESIVPCTPKGIMVLLEEYKIPIEGKHAVVVGRSKTVGKPAALLLLNKNATVTIAHSKTKDLSSITRLADILVVAVGKPNAVTKDMVKEGATIIDVGINRVDGKIVGDVDKRAAEKAAYITPVPGGVGPMTVAMLLANTVQCHALSEKK